MPKTDIYVHELVNKVSRSDFLLRVCHKNLYFSKVRGCYVSSY